MVNLNTVNSKFCQFKVNLTGIKFKVVLIWSFNSNSVVIESKSRFKSNFTVIQRLCIRIYIVIWLYVLTVSTYTVKTIRMASYLVACSMQHVSTVLTYPGSRKTCFFCIPVFGRKVFLIFPIIYLTGDLKLICMIGLSGLINSLIFANIYPGWHNYSLWGLLFQFHGLLVSWLLNFIE